jgi:hypothetical protein
LGPPARLPDDSDALAEPSDVADDEAGGDTAEDDAEGVAAVEDE